MPLPFIVWAVAASLHVPGSAPAALASSLASSPTQQDPSPSGAPAVDLEPTVVRPKERAGYRTDTASAGTRTSVPLRETPLSVQVIPEELVQDQAVWRLKDTYRNVSGVQPSKTEGFALTFENAFVRGFEQRPYLDGGRTWGLGPVDVAGLESLEVLKGPASLLYGALEPGGVINLVPKTPRFSPRHNMSITAGSYDFYRATFDTTGPLGNDENLAYRIAGAVQDSRSFRDTLEDQSLFLAPSFEWRPSEDSRLTAWVWYQNRSKPVDDGVAFSSAGKPIASIDTFLGDPDHNSQSVEDTFLGLKFEHDLHDDLTFRQEIQLHYFDAEMDAVRRFGTTSSSETVTPFYDASTFVSWDGNLRSELLLDADHGSWRHHLLAGVQAFRRDYKFRRRRDTASIGEISILNPNFPTLDYVINNAGDSAQDVRFVGLYLQDQLTTMDDRLHVLAGARFDHFTQNNHPDTQQDNLPSWNLGALFDLTPSVSPYFNVANSFNPTGTNRMTSSGEPLDPENGVQFEVGAKMTFLDGKLGVNAAIYEITKNDVAIADPSDTNFSLNAGELRSRGVELDVTGRVSPGLQIIGSYAYTDTEVVRSDALPEGGRFRGIPLHGGSLWLKYDGFDDGGPFENLGVGAGVFTSSEKAGDNDDTFSLPSYERVDLAAWYDTEIRNGGNARFQLNVMNLFDTEYYESSFNVARVQPGAPLTVMASLALTF
ncbi:Ferrichrome-iron receptor precursor [Planctomycetes bacterium Poly30]|uniref:Ferrichrome-iron receptor n=1 Tax=Saltatorellus ferox TaxID=2528018 RepID=A0A518EVN3_9BACT|nr:Ferrichrome-iron receptor precursor [Planctomycetes bacterium Poly30]